MIKTPNHDQVGVTFRLQFKPRPASVLFLTLFTCALLSIFLYTISTKSLLFKFSDTSASDLEIPLGKLGSDNGIEKLSRLTSYQTILKDDSEAKGNCAVNHRFPPTIMQWCDLITRYANKRGLPPDLVAALIWQESGGDPVAYSQSGAVGLMQVMPRDGIAASFACANGPCFANRPTTQELQDPEYNIAYGTRLLAGLLGRHGDMREALKYYGPKDVGYYYADKVFGLFQRYGEQSS